VARVSNADAAIAIVQTMMNTFQLVALTYLAIIARRNGH
jgi:hypothetical protein